MFIFLRIEDCFLKQNPVHKGELDVEISSVQLINGQTKNKATHPNKRQFKNYPEDWKSLQRLMNIYFEYPSQTVPLVRFESLPSLNVQLRLFTMKGMG